MDDQKHLLTYNVIIPSIIYLLDIFICVKKIIFIEESVCITIAGRQKKTPK
jgi:hypothetical protein